MLALACSESTAPPIVDSAAMASSPGPATAAPQTDTATPKPVGPHGQRDPHATLDPDRLIKVALQHDSEGRLELALKTLAEGIDKFPQSAQLYAVRASMRLQLKQVSLALADLEKAVRLAPDDASIRVNRAQAYRSFGRYEDALQDLNLAVEKSPDLIAARFNRGALFYAQNDLEKALADFEHCIAVDPHAPAPYFNRASTYWELGRSDAALTDLEHFLTLVDNEQWKQTAQDLLENWQAALVKQAKATQGDS